MQQNQNKELAHRRYDQAIANIQTGDWPKALRGFAEAFQLDSQNIRYLLFLGGALWHTGKPQAALQLWSLGADKDPMVRIAQYHEQADPLTRRMSQLADTELRRYLSGLQSDVIDKCGHESAGRIATALWPQTHIAKVPYADNGPKPYMFFAPNLPEQPAFDRNQTDWARTLEKSTDEIRAEFLALMSAEDKPGSPYVNRNSFLGSEWDGLKGQMDWSAVHLFSDSKPTPDAARCPRTCKALEDIPLVYHGGNPMEVFFSVLRPGTHIPPHYGLANCRVTTHLPLIIPDNCAIRVADILHEWREGETLIFDDSFDHEAWNKSGETRVVLIFEAWRPDMTDGEIKAVEASYQARQAWLSNRKIPDLEALSTPGKG